MADRGILMSAPMVRALLAGTKTQTRRLLGFQPPLGFEFSHFYETPKHYQVALKSPVPIDGITTSSGAIRYAPGDRLWVRETWKPGSWREDGRVACDWRASPDLVQTPWCQPDNFDDLWPKWTDELLANGSTPDVDGMHRWEPGQSPMKWRSPIHMPRWASRLTLTVTEVRVQRVQEISEADAIAEGLLVDYDGDVDGDGRHIVETSYQEPGGAWIEGGPCDWYADLWNSLHTKPGERWEDNPWVTAVSFETRRGNIDGGQG